MQTRQRAEMAGHPIADISDIVGPGVGDERELVATVALADAAQAVPPFASSSEDKDQLPPGTAIEDYVIRSTIGSGGGGRVFLAEHQPSARLCAFKVLHSELARNPVGLARFVREVSVVKLVEHPAIVEIYDTGELPDGRPYFAMELLQGPNLRQLIAERGRFSTEEVLEILPPICSALGAAHAAGIVHRDVKASNVHMTQRDGRCEIKLLDFGVAKLLAPEDDKTGLTRPGTSLGTPATMAPEQVRGEPVDQRTDVYALGALVYNLLTGRLPFRATSRQEIELLILTEPPPPPSRFAPVSAAVDAVVLRCLEKAASARYPSVAAVAEAFFAAAASATQTSESATAKQAVAICISVATGNLDDDSEDSDLLLDDVTAVLDMAENALRETAWTPVLHTATTLLVAQILSEDAGPRDEQIAAAREQALAVARRIATREEPHPQLSVAVSTHVAAAVVSGGGSCQEIDGPIVDVDSWPTDTLVERTGARA